MFSFMKKVKNKKFCYCFFQILFQTIRVTGEQVSILFHRTFALHWMFFYYTTRKGKMQKFFKDGKSQE